MDVGISSQGWTAGDALTEVVERKGSGHPDVLADRVAESVSQYYAAYCMEHFGFVPDHNTDRTVLVGGSSRVRFGGGQLTGPVVALVNGNLPEYHDGRQIPVTALVHHAVREVFDATLVHFDGARDLRVSGTRSIASDTSCGVGFAPRSRLERLVGDAEGLITEVAERHRPGSVGTDIKVLATRIGRRLRLAAAVRVVDAAIENLDQYLELCELLRRELTAYAEAEGYEPVVVVNAGDKDTVVVTEPYLTVTGSSIESGNEGVVGRGTPYHLIAEQVATRLYEHTGCHIGVTLVSPAGHPLREPVFVGVTHDSRMPLSESLVRSVVDGCVYEVSLS